MWSKTPPKATEKELQRQSTRGSDDAPVDLPGNTTLLLQGRDSSLRQRWRLGGRIFFCHLVVKFLGLIRLLPRLVEAGEFELGGSFADDECRLIHQLLIKIDRLRVLVLRAINGSQRELAQGREVGVR